jgi:hypothetical protein
MSTDPARQSIRHTLATVAYRAAKVLRDAPPHFGTYHIGDKTRTPSQILAHMGDLYDWAYAMATGNPAWHDSQPLPWPDEHVRFFAALKKFDDFLAADEPLQFPLEKLFQGPVADSLTHVGQIAMLRRLANAPVKAENYLKAEIIAGRVGAEQSTARREFE